MDINTSSGTAGTLDDDDWQQQRLNKFFNPEYEDNDNNCDQTKILHSYLANSAFEVKTERKGTSAFDKVVDL